MTAKGLAVLLLCVMPMVALAGPPATRPAARRGEGGAPAWIRERAQRMLEPISEEEWDQAVKFYAENTPRRWARFEKLSPNDPAYAAFRRMLVVNYRRIEETAGEDPVLYQNRLQQIHLEDKIYGMVLDLAGLEGKAAQQKTAEIRAAVDQLIGERLEERRLRIERLERALATEKQRLEEDANNRETIVNRRLKDVLEGKAEWMPSPRANKGPAAKGGKEPAAK